MKFNGKSKQDAVAILTKLRIHGEVEVEFREVKEEIGVGKEKTGFFDSRVRESKRKPDL